MVCLEAGNTCKFDVALPYPFSSYFSIYKSRGSTVSPMPLLMLLFLLICWNCFTSFLHCLDCRVPFMDYYRAFPYSFPVGLWLVDVLLPICVDLVWLDNFRAQAFMASISTQPVNATGTFMAFYCCFVKFHLWFVNVFKFIFCKGLSLSSSYPLTMVSLGYGIYLLLCLWRTLICCVICWHTLTASIFGCMLCIFYPQSGLTIMFFVSSFGWPLWIIRAVGLVLLLCTSLIVHILYVLVIYFQFSFC